MAKNEDELVKRAMDLKDNSRKMGRQLLNDVVTVEFATDILSETLDKPLTEGD